MGMEAEVAVEVDVAVGVSIGVEMGHEGRRCCGRSSLGRSVAISKR